MTEYFIRHGDYFTVVTIVKDPVFLTEPLVRTSNWILNLGYAPTPQSCVPSREIDRPEEYVAHHLPGANPFLLEFPESTDSGGGSARGAETMYPEYQDTLAKLARSSQARGEEEVMGRWLLAMAAVLVFAVRATEGRPLHSAGQRVCDLWRGREHHGADRRPGVTLVVPGSRVQRAGSRRPSGRCRTSPSASSSTPAWTRITRAATRAWLRADSSCWIRRIKPVRKRRWWRT